MASKKAEAEEHCKQADRYLKTGVFRWKPDYEAAADSLCLAGQCYRVIRDIAKCRDCYVRASEAYKKNNSNFHAAKALENLIIICKERFKPNELYDLATEASHLYQLHGSVDSAAVVLSKTAKILQDDNPLPACKLYAQAADVSSGESYQHQSAEYTSKVSRLYVKMNMLEPAVDSLRKEIGYYQELDNVGVVGRLTVAIVLVQLARGDVVAAEKAYKEWGNNCEATEMQTIEQLLQAYDEGDQESAKRALHSPFIRSMDVEYSRLAASIPLPQGMEGVPTATVRENAAASYVSPSTMAAAYCGRRYDDEESPYEAVNIPSQEEKLAQAAGDRAQADEDEEAGGLC